MVEPVQAELEEWRPVVDFEGLYEVSNLGRVRNPRRKKPGNILAGGQASKWGHRKVVLWRDGSPSGAWVHRIVLHAFVGPPPKGGVCRHLDGDATNNVVSNLAWGTPADNSRDQAAHGTHAKGVNSNLTEEDVWAIRALKDVVSRGYVAELFSIQPAVVSNIWNRVYWRWAGEPRKPEDFNRSEGVLGDLRQELCGPDGRADSPVSVGTGDRQGGGHSCLSGAGKGTGGGS